MSSPALSVGAIESPSTRITDSFAAGDPVSAFQPARIEREIGPRRPPLPESRLGRPMRAPATRVTGTSSPNAARSSSGIPPSIDSGIWK